MLRCYPNSAYIIQHTVNWHVCANNKWHLLFHIFFSFGYFDAHSMCVYVGMQRKEQHVRF